MWILLIGIFILGIFTLLIHKLQVKKQLSSNDIQKEELAVCSNSEYCCGAHEVCESGKMKKRESAFDYYDDEELDRFRNRPEGDYTTEEVEEFKDVLETLQFNEIENWLKSLYVREISFPETLKRLLAIRLQEDSQS